MQGDAGSIGPRPFTLIPGGAQVSGHTAGPEGPRLPAHVVPMHVQPPQPPQVQLPEQDQRIRMEVRRAASRHQSFESALLSMVEAASGVSGPKAEAIASAIMANDQLRSQAERAYSSQGLRGV